ncbi:oxygen-independent coproporphyrinogen III oxidase [Yoonia sp. 208BN28-4]|uniref:oxygen-independent coproporphyrinogen III oxidase n=1 Tax=Yoonia sp. 208BN28-4 TaxID=3126505 RepID=UPI0030A3616A
MEKIDTLRRFGLFDARVPRYTSYPPANHFANGIGHQFHADWLQTVTDGSVISVYIHIPFCKRLCWFCACRTQGTRTMRPVDAYVQYLLKELSLVRDLLPKDVKMGRLHLGGGTPSILPPDTMANLLDAVYAAFPKADDYEFSVEIDPTEAAPDLLRTLANYGMNRASVGVQDFAEKVQSAIGRLQSFEQTRDVIALLRDLGVQSLNVDLLYGLPFQTKSSFQATLDQVAELKPDRLAIYGYAHVPWMSKRQVMIDGEALPGPEKRFWLAEQAHAHFTALGYAPIGIDHFALPTDSLYKADQAGTLRRNFQGYTDDQSEALIGLGASAISRFPQGFVHNAPATSAYQERIASGGLAGQKGYRMDHADDLTSQIVEDLMCRFCFDATSLGADFPDMAEIIEDTRLSLLDAFPGIFLTSADGLIILDNAKPLVRIIASFVDSFTSSQTAHSAAI